MLLLYDKGLQKKFDFVELRKKRLSYLKWMLIFATIPLLLAELALLIADNAPSLEAGMAGLAYCSITVGFIGYIVCNYKFSGSFYYNHGESYKGSHYEVSSNSDGTRYKVEKVDDYSSNDNFGTTIIIFLTSIIWFIPYYIYISINTRHYLKNNLPFGVGEAYGYAQKHTKHTFAMTSKEYSRLSSMESNYRAAVDRVKEKYRFCDEEVINKEISKIPKTIVRGFVANSEGKATKAIVAEFQSTSRKSYDGGGIYHKYFLVYKDTDGSVKGKVSISEPGGDPTRGYIIYSESTDWKEEWIDAGVSEETWDNLNRYTVNL